MWQGMEGLIRNPATEKSGNLTLQDARAERADGFMPGPAPAPPSAPRGLCSLLALCSSRSQEEGQLGLLLLGVPCPQGAAWHAQG